MEIYYTPQGLRWGIQLLRVSDGERRWPLQVKFCQFDTESTSYNERDCLYYRIFAMDFTDNSVTQNSPYTVNRRPSGGSSVKTIFGFPVDQNQFTVLQASQPAETQC